MGGDRDAPLVHLVVVPARVRHHPPQHGVPLGEHEVLHGRVDRWHVAGSLEGRYWSVVATSMLAMHINSRHRSFKVDIEP